MISPATKLLVIYRMKSSPQGLYQKMIDLPAPIETSGVDFGADFQEAVTQAFQAAMVVEHADANEAWNRGNRDARSLRTYGDEGDRYTIVAVFGIGARPRALWQPEGVTARHGAG